MPDELRNIYRKVALLVDFSIFEGKKSRLVTPLKLIYLEKAVTTCNISKLP